MTTVKEHGTGAVSQTRKQHDQFGDRGRELSECFSEEAAARFLPIAKQEAERFAKVLGPCISPWEMGDLTHTVYIDGYWTNYLNEDDFALRYIIRFDIVRAYGSLNNWRPDRVHQPTFVPKSKEEMDRMVGDRHTSPATTAEAYALLDDIKEAVPQTRQRIAFLKRYLFGESYVDIGKEMGCSGQWAKAMATKGRAKAEKHLRNLGYDYQN
jgi:hypothetical protein